MDSLATYISAEKIASAYARAASRLEPFSSAELSAIGLPEAVKQPVRQARDGGLA